MCPCSCSHLFTVDGHIARRPAESETWNEELSQRVTPKRINHDQKNHSRHLHFYLYIDSLGDTGWNHLFAHLLTGLGCSGQSGLDMGRTAEPISPDCGF